MIIYDPPTADATKEEWERYLSSLDWRTDAEEIAAARQFIKMRFTDGFDLTSLLE